MPLENPSAYLQANPDVAKAYQDYVANPGASSSKYWSKRVRGGSAEDFAQAHYRDSGYKENRRLAPVAQQVAQAHHAPSFHAPPIVHSVEPAKIEPVFRQVSPQTDTVAGQLDTLLAKDSPYLQRARTRGMQFARDRGLQNSSLAAQAGEAAAIDAALPVATQDANTYFTQGINNQNIQNRKLEQDRAFLNSFELMKAEFGFNGALQMQALEFQAAEQLERDYRIALLDAFTTEGVTPQQQRNAVEHINTIFGRSPVYVSNYANIPSATGHRST